MLLYGTRDCRATFLLLPASRTAQYGRSHRFQESEVGLALVPATPNSTNAARASRLLEALHPVCSHDLPNQIVALQSLLQLFSWDEADHLTPQGREYFD